MFPDLVTTNGVLRCADWNGSSQTVCGLGAALGPPPRRRIWSNLDDSMSMMRWAETRSPPFIYLSQPSRKTTPFLLLSHLTPLQCFVYSLQSTAAEDEKSQFIFHGTTDVLPLDTVKFPGFCRRKNFRFGSSRPTN